MGRDFRMTSGGTHYALRGLANTSWDLGRKYLVERCDAYRQFAAQCLELARQLDRPYDRTVLLEMALMWSRLAEHAAKYSLPKEPLEPA